MREAVRAIALSAPLALLAALGLPSVAVGQPDHGTCVLLVKQGDSYAQQELPGFDPSNTAVKLPIPKPELNARAVICRRSTIVPATSDYRVLQEMGLPFDIISGDTLLVLEMVEGQFQVRVVEGEPSPEDMQLIQARIDEMQSITQGDVPAP